MEYTLNEKQIIFLIALLGNQNDEDYKLEVESNPSISEEEKGRIYSFVDSQGAFGLFSDLYDLAREEKTKN